MISFLWNVYIQANTMGKLWQQRQKISKWLSDATAGEKCQLTGKGLLFEVIKIFWN